MTQAALTMETEGKKRQKEKENGTHLLLLDQSPRITLPSRTRRSPHPVHVFPNIHRRVVTDDMLHGADVDTSRYKVGANKAIFCVGALKE